MTWWARGQRDGRPSGQAGAQGLLYFTGTGTWHGKFPHHSTELDQGLQHKAPPPLKSSVTHMLAASFPTSEHLCECFLMHASVASVKRPSPPITLLFWLCAALSLGVAPLPFAPSGLFSIFKTQQTSSVKNRHELRQAGSRHEKHYNVITHLTI